MLPKISVPGTGHGRVPPEKGGDWPFGGSSAVGARLAAEFSLFSKVDQRRGARSSAPEVTRRSEEAALALEVHH